MLGYKFRFVFQFILIINFCLCDIVTEKKNRLYATFIDHLKKLPDQPYVLRDGILQNISQLNENSYHVEIRVEAADNNNPSLQYVKCSGTLYDRGSSIEVDNTYYCQDDSQYSANVNHFEHVVTEGLPVPTVFPEGPVQLYNEVQSVPTTSGEQFIAVPTERKPCIGCASQVNPEAPGVLDLALLGVNQLDLYEPLVRHTVNKVLTVERQVQVVNGVRYVLTVLVDYNTCTEVLTEPCIVTKPCKVSILDKPWLRRPDGSRHRVIVANNCTDAWLFDDNENNHDTSNDPLNPTPNYNNIPNIGSIDDIITSVHNPDIKSQPGIEKELTDEDIKNIEQQIIPNVKTTKNYHDTQETTKVINGDDHHAQEFSNVNSDILLKGMESSSRISEDKKKAVDEFLFFFDYAGFYRHSDMDPHSLRFKRSYNNDLKFLNLAEHFNRMKKSIDNAKQIYTLAQSMVDYLNEMDIEIKNRVLNYVIAAEEELDNNQHFFYIKALVVIPCGKIECDYKDKLTKICNAVIDGTNNRSPQVLTTFCYDENKQKSTVSKIKTVPLDDPILLNLANDALLQIENESSSYEALKIIKMISADTHKVSGTLTKLTMVIATTNCNKTKDLKNRNNCRVQYHMGSKICDVEVLERQWLKDKSISYSCTIRPMEESYSSGYFSKRSINDSDILEILQEAIQYLGIQSVKNSKQKVVEVKSVSTQLVAGLLTTITFSVGYTTCKNGLISDTHNCELIINEPLRDCVVYVWHRPWLEDGRQMNVSCEIESIVNDEIGKRQVPGGETIQDNREPKYHALALESLQKYLQTSGASGSHKIVTVDNVITQIVAGLKTKIDFTVTNSDSDVIKCHSEVWEQTWLNKKEIDVNCKIVDQGTRQKRQVPGGETIQDNREPKYHALALESLQKYLQTSGASGSHKIVTVDNVITQIVAGLKTKIDFTVTNSDSDVIKCHSEVWEQRWLNKKEVDVNCKIVDQGTRQKRQVPGGETIQDNREPKYHALALESLQKYLQTSGASGSHKIVTVDNVITQIVAGLKTKIDFTVTNSDSDVIKCHSEVWEQTWLNKKEVDVNCKIVDQGTRQKRQVPGGETIQDNREPKYHALALESLQKYLQTSGASGSHKIVTVDNVITQIVAGLKTKIDFTVTNSDSDVIKCHSEVWEQTWLNKKEVDVNCKIVDQGTRQKRQVPGGETIQDNREPKYHALALESLQKYLQTSGASGSHKIVTVDNVITQIVAGLKTKIDFTVTNSDSDVIKCHSEVWEQTWLNKKEVDVNCKIVDQGTRQKRQVPGGETIQDNREPKYHALALESLQKYLQTSGASGSHKIVTVDNVITQIVAGLKTKIDFTVTNSDSDVIKCHSEVWEQRWLNKKEVDVNCKIVDQGTRQKRQVPGGETIQDNREPKYHALALESLQKYLQTSGASGSHKIVTVDNVITQIVAGLKTKIDFTVTNSDSDVIKCHSEVWEQTWLNKKEVDVNCKTVDQGTRQKRQVPGGETIQDNREPKYHSLALESLQKYLQTSGASGSHKIVTVDNVITQIVAGLKTKIDFTVTNSDSDVIKCHSEVWEQTWLNKKEVDVNCKIVDQGTRQKRQVPGGETIQDNREPKYHALALESLQKYLQTSGASGSHKIVTVDNVITQIVAGLKTKIDFTVTNSDSDVIKCHSEVWEQTWLNKKEVDVNCKIVDQGTRQKRQVPGGETIQDNREPKYHALALESLQKYLQTSGASGSHKIVTVDNVITQIVAGLKTKIDFTVTNSDSDVIKCHSEVWEQTWLNKKEVDVNCKIVDQGTRQKRQVPGGETIQDNREPKYHALALESLQKYLQTSGASGSHKIVTVDNVITQIVAGLKTKIDFTVTNSDSDVIKCHSEVWEQTWLNKKEVDVNCKIVDQGTRQKRQVLGGETIQDNREPKYHALALESLQKYLQTSGASGSHKIVTVDNVITQIVAGLKTKIDFTVTNSDSDVIKCHSEVWEQTWLNKKEVDVNCKIVDQGTRQKRQVLGGETIQDNREPKYHALFKPEKSYKKTGRHKNVGVLVEQDASKQEYSVLADESLRKHQRLQHIKSRHKVLEVKRVSTQIVSGIIYNIDFIAVPKTCTANVSAVSSCTRADQKTILYCHSQIWDRPWMTKKIDVSCIDYDLDLTDDEYNSNDRLKRSVLGGMEKKDANDDEYMTMAERATQKFEEFSDTEYHHKVVKINEVFEQVVSGFITTIKFSISPTMCLKGEKISKDDCQLQKPKCLLRCVAKITDRTIIGLSDDIFVRCKNSINNNNRFGPEVHQDIRHKRETRAEDDIDEDTKYYYADRVLNHLNERSNTDNMLKLITIHDVLSSVQMKTHMVRMYIETAPTFCLRHDNEIDLNSCDELDGTSHKLCLAKIFPSADDELIVQRVTVVCDDEPDFLRLTGISIPDLVSLSISYIESSKDKNYKLVHRGEPYIVPSLHVHVPVILSFIVASTNCSKFVDIDKDNVNCFVDTSIPDKVCQSFIWMVPATRRIIHMKANCSGSNQVRIKRSVTAANTTIDIKQLVAESLQKLEMVSLHRYKQRVLNINSYSTKITTGRLTTIDFDVGYTNCLKYEWVDNITKCEFLEHLPRRHCVSEVWERLWFQNGRDIQVNCQDDETPLEAHIEFESAETAMQLAKQALKHIEAKYPHPKKQLVVRIFSLEKQAVAGLHYKMKIEVGFSNCTALSVQKNCQLVNDGPLNRFCRVNVWIRPWTDHPPNYRVTCDYQSGASTELFHILQAERLFYDFLATYRPDYVNDHVEMSKRFEIFKANIRKIHDLNTHEKGTATYAVTRFADLTYDEFSSKFLGLKTNLRDANQIPMGQAKIPNVEVPDSFDWRKLGAVTEVKDQGSCGSCWAFSVTGNIEGQWQLKTGELLSLSEQELIDCDKLDSGCNGGYMDNAYRAIEQLGGMEVEDDYPYEGEDEKCSFNKTIAKVQITGAVNITSNETDMAKWLVRKGPISIGINANAMQFYVGGVSHPWKMLCNPKNLDHGVLIVGYGVKDYPLFHKKLPYWTVKNSWGPSWGEQGYYRVYRGDGTCGVNQMASSAVL